MSKFSVQTRGNDGKSDATKHGQHLSLTCVELGSYSTQDNVNASNNDNSNINNNTKNSTSNNEFKIGGETTQSEDGKTLEPNHIQFSMNNLTQDLTNPNRSVQILFAPSLAVNNDGINNNINSLNHTFGIQINKKYQQIHSHIKSDGDYMMKMAETTLLINKFTATCNEIICIESIATCGVPSEKDEAV